MILTVGLNLFIRVPAVQQWIQGRLRSMTSPDPQHGQDHAEPVGRSSVRVFFPWKAMLIGSILLTVLINVLGAFR